MSQGKHLGRTDADESEGLLKRSPTRPHLRFLSFAFAFREDGERQGACRPVFTERTSHLPPIVLWPMIYCLVDPRKALKTRMQLWTREEYPSIRGDIRTPAYIEFIEG